MEMGDHREGRGVVEMGDHREEGGLWRWGIIKGGGG